MKILHGIKFYGFTVGDKTVKLKSVNFYSIYSIMSLLKIWRGTWTTMTPDLIKATAYGSAPSLLPSTAQLFIHNWCPNEYSFPIQNNRLKLQPFLHLARVQSVVLGSQPLFPVDHAATTRDYVKRASCIWTSVKLKSSTFIFSIIFRQTVKFNCC